MIAIPKLTRIGKESFSYHKVPIHHLPKQLGTQIPASPLLHQLPAFFARKTFIKIITSLFHPIINVSPFPLYADVGSALASTGNIAIGDALLSNVVG